MKTIKITGSGQLKFFVMGRHFTCPIAKEENWRQFSFMKLVLAHWRPSAKMQEDWGLLPQPSSPTAWPLRGEQEDEAYYWGHRPSVSHSEQVAGRSWHGKGRHVLKRMVMSGMTGRHDCHFLRVPKEQKTCPLSISLKLARSCCCRVRKAIVAAKPGCND